MSVSSQAVNQRLVDGWRGSFIRSVDTSDRIETRLNMPWIPTIIYPLDSLSSKVFWATNPWLKYVGPFSILNPKVYFGHFLHQKCPQTSTQTSACSPILVTMWKVHVEQRNHKPQCFYVDFPLNCLSAIWLTAHFNDHDCARSLDLLIKVFFKMDSKPTLRLSSSQQFCFMLATLI